MFKLIFLRHGSTSGNVKGRYIGSKTDESLCEEGIAQLLGFAYPDVDMVFSSPMKRCLETAHILYKQKPLYIIEDAKECDFGDFENKNYKELNGNEDYQKWIDSNATLPFPNGEDIKEFKKRSIKAFLQILQIVEERNQIQPISSIAIITHGGVIMSILEAYSADAFYDFQIKNGQGFEIVYENGEMLEIHKL